MQLKTENTTAQPETKVFLYTAKEIRKAVDKGKTVHSGNELYKVVKDKIG